MTLKRHHLPVWANWIAQDADGVWWTFEHEPNLGDKSWYENEVGSYARICHQTPNKNWRKSLQKITASDMDVSK